MAKRVFLGLSIGNMPAKAGLRSGILNLSTIRFIPISSIISCMTILTKIRDEDVVSSSFMWTTLSTAQEMPSEARR